MTNQITHPGAYRCRSVDFGRRTSGNHLAMVDYPRCVPARHGTFHAFHGAETVIRTE